jgi:hypothetical protein
LANAGESAVRTLSAEIPIPSGVTVNGIIGGLDIMWDAVDFDNLAYYEVQVDDNASFSTPTSITAPSNKATAKGLSATNSVRIRTVARDGKVSDWSDTVSVAVPTSVWLGDQDLIEPVNRTRISPQPETLGETFSTPGGDSAFVGIGAGCGNQSQYDSSGSDAWNVPGSQVTLSLQRNNTRVQTATLFTPDSVIEEAQGGDVTTTFPFDHTEVANGTILHFFTSDISTETTTFWDTLFLEFFESSPHEQLGRVDVASMGIVKF